MMYRLCEYSNQCEFAPVPLVEFCDRTSVPAHGRSNAHDSRHLDMADYVLRVILIVNLALTPSILTPLQGVNVD